MKTRFEEKKFVIAAATSAIDLKNVLKKHFEEKGYEIIDVGALSDEKPMAYYDAGANAARTIKEGKCEFGIVLCGSGMGVCMTANRFPGIHCAICESIHTAKLSRCVNNANMLALGAFIIAPKLAILMAEAFIETEFLEGYSGKDRENLMMSFEKLNGIEKDAIQKYGCSECK